MRQIGWLLLLAVAVCSPGGERPAAGGELLSRAPLLAFSREPAPPEHPAPDPERAEKDAERAIAELESRARSEALIQETLRPPFRRPHLTYDVWSGIQARNIDNVLRRR